jgi:AbrB family looped-hinge helix DNA binding protein
MALNRKVPVVHQPEAVRIVKHGGGFDPSPDSHADSEQFGMMYGSMTFGGAIMATRRNLVRVQEKGQVTLPAAVRNRHGLKKGDLVAITDTPDGILITPQEVVATRALDRIGVALREQGLSLDDLIESGRTEREDLLREMYEIESPKEST